ncbi:hypothetical protein B0H14DRAFT_2641786 [Mycena olivaceomarginata]|nr:hypothetical protein B0H14DRAFT_2641786 [Mycena olivaceomarginata]
MNNYPNYDYGHLLPPYPTNVMLVRQARQPLGVARFLTGVTDQLPPMGAHAMECFAPALQNGPFDSAQNGYLDPFGGHQPPTLGRDSTGPSLNLMQKQQQPAVPAPHHPDFEALIPQITPVGQQLEVPLRLERNITPNKFLKTIRKNMKVAEDLLGWKTSDVSNKADPQLLSDEDDAKTAIGTVLVMNDSLRQQKLISLRIVKLSAAPPDKVLLFLDGFVPLISHRPPRPRKPKEMELAYREEIAVIKQHTACQKCGEGKWYRIHRYGTKAGKHIPFTWEIITLWAWLMVHRTLVFLVLLLINFQKNNPGKVSRDCSAPLNILCFDEYVQKKELHQQHSSRPSSTNIEVKPDIHIQLADGPLGPAFTSHGQRNMDLGKRAREVTHKDGDDNEMVAIEELLQLLHAKIPKANFGQYADTLDSTKISYCHQLLDVSEEDLLQIGVGHGMVKDLVHGACKLLHSAMKQRVDNDKENNKVIEVS